MPGGGKRPGAGRKQGAATKKTRAIADQLTEADRARAIVLTLAGWTSGEIGEAFGVREDTVRLWRSDFMRGGVEALKASPPPGPAPVKSEAALKVAEALLTAPMADRTNWTLARLGEEVRRREGLTVSRLAQTAGGSWRRYRQA
jgi:transposase